MRLPYIIAEIGLNHEGSANRAMTMIREAASAGANAAKFQAVNPDTLVSKIAPPYFHQEGEAAQSQYEFFWRVGEPFDVRIFRQLAKYCQECGIDFLCTAFDVETVEWLNPLVSAFKIASADIVNIPLLTAVRDAAMTHYHGGYNNEPKAIYVSTGAATREEVNAAWKFFHRTPNVTFLHCVLSYPTRSPEAQLGTMRGLPAPYGYSDHTLFNLDVLTTAWLLGATVIEKHFTLDKTLSGNDHYHSMDPSDLRALVAKLKELQVMIGDGEKRVLPCEEAARLNARQSWHAARDMEAGHVIQIADVVLKRPGTGIPASAGQIQLMTLKTAVQADEAITYDMIADPYLVEL